MKYLFAVLALCFSSSLLAQDTVSKKPVDSISTITVHKDARLDQLIKKQSYVNDITSREGRRTDKGFRLMIVSTTSRDEAMAAKTRVYTYFPELKAYLWYQSPYFRVKAGNFKDRKDAEEFQKRLNNYFPKGVFIMKDIIEVKPGKAGESEN